MHTGHRYDESRDVKEMIGELFVSIKQGEASWTNERNGGLLQLGQLRIFHLNAVTTANRELLRIVKFIYN